MTKLLSLQSNQLLNALSRDVFKQLSFHLEFVHMPFGQVLHEAGEKLNYVYFPVTSIVSISYDLENGTSAEVAMVGNDGVVGVSVFMGSVTSTNRAVVRSAGTGFRIKSKLLKEAFKQNASLMALLLRYTQAFINQMAQTALCNRHHLLEQQLCRWLLFSLDRMQSNEMAMTQELIANMLGVRREGVTEAASKLQRQGIIQYQRGHILVIDRINLEFQCCECYHVVKNEFDRLLKPQPCAKTTVVLK